MRKEAEVWEPDASHGIAAHQVFEYAEKMPYVSSGHGDRGLLRYSRELDSIQCHECGEWMRSLSAHLKVHGITAREYKIRHGLNLATGLITPSVKERLAQANFARPKFMAYARSSKRPPVHVVKGTTFQTGENANINSTCQAQIMATYFTLRARLGRVPKFLEFRDFGGPAIATLKRRFSGKNYSEFAGFCEGTPRTRSDGLTRYSKDVLIELLRDHYVRTKRVPVQTTFKEMNLPSYGIYVRAFGSWEAAMSAAGLGAVYDLHVRRHRRAA